MNCEVGQGAEETVEQQHLNKQRRSTKHKIKWIGKLWAATQRQICSL